MTSSEQSRQYWQIASGSSGRNYAKYFTRHGLAFVGGKDNIEQLAQVQPGDVLLLKSGRSKVVAAGVIVTRDRKHSGNANRDGNADKDWLHDFDGWDLPAYCYVDWYRPGSKIEISGLSRATIQRLPQREHQEIACAIIQSNLKFFDELLAEPTATKELSEQDVFELLNKEGLRPNVADELTAALRKISLLAYYYRKDCRWEDVREHETRTFLIVPLLLALGWTAQEIKIELPVPGGRVDIACFPDRYRQTSDCVLLLESKDFSSGLDYAPDQAARYAQSLPKCNIIVTSNGFCYRAYTRKNEGLKGFELAGYLNLLRPRDSFPLEPKPDNGALGLLRCLLPPRGAAQMS
jgi:hypothetical protein